MLRSAVEFAIGWNRRISLSADRLAARWIDRTGGLADFTARVVPGLLREHLRVLDVGGGRRPVIDPRDVARLRLHVTGLDLSENELRAAPPGSYQATIVGDVGQLDIEGPYDLILSRAVLEHVADPAAALRSLSAALAPGGAMAHVVPCGRAPFAVAHRILGHRLSRRLLRATHPDRTEIESFEAYYRLCVPSQMAALCRRDGLEIAEITPHFASDYLHFCAPLHLVELSRQTLFALCGLTDWCETFILVARKPAPAASQPAAEP